MKEKRDPRINIGYSSLKEYILLFWVLAAFNGFHMWLYQEFLNRNLLETNIRFVINFLIIYVAIAAAGITSLTAVIRHISWNRPMRKLSEAARKITHGDFSARITPLRKDGKKDYVEVMFDDFNTMAEELSSIETLKNDFISDVSHEIKTPLSIIQSYTTAIQSDTLRPEERMEYTKTILEATKKLSVLVTNILKLNKLENRTAINEAKPFDLTEQLRRCALSVADLMEQKNIRFEEDLDEASVCYDENMLEIVWNNLLSNAIKFTNPGGSIIIRAKVHPGQGFSDKKSVQVSVTDTGCGMNEATQKRIFDKFYQGDTSHTMEGNGLGLSLIRKTLDLLGENITVDSTLGKGSTFTVILHDLITS